MTTKIEEIPAKEIIKGFHGRMIHTEKLTMAYWEVEEGSVLPEHAHLHEQVTQVTSGRFEMTIDGATQIYEPGMLAVIPSQVLHSGKALTDCTITDVFAPARDDYR